MRTISKKNLEIGTKIIHRASGVSWEVTDHWKGRRSEFFELKTCEMTRYRTLREILNEYCFEEGGGQ